MALSGSLNGIVISQVPHSNDVFESVAICNEMSCVLSVVVVVLLQWENWTVEDIWP